jgi:hypothetical protein
VLFSIVLASEVFVSNKILKVLLKKTQLGNKFCKFFSLSV